MSTCFQATALHKIQNHEKTAALQAHSPISRSDTVSSEWTSSLHTTTHSWFAEVLKMQQSRQGAKGSSSVDLSLARVQLFEATEPELAEML